MTENRNILICELNIDLTGHYIGHSQYILDHIQEIEQQQKNKTYYFLFNKKGRDLLKFNEFTSSRVSFLEELSARKKRLVERNAIARKVRNFCSSKKIDDIILMELDKNQISLYLANFDCRLSGILFRPSHRLTPTHEGLKDAILNRIVRTKKKFADRLLVKNKAVSNIFLFNDKEGVETMNKLYKTSKFKYLPDPIYTIDSNESFSTKIPFSKSTFKLLIFGALDERKNITNVLKAYSEAKLESDSELLLVGHSNLEYQEYLKTLIASLPAIDNKHKRVYIRPEFVTDQEMDYYFSITDAVVIVYKDFFGSSGLMGRATLHQKKILGADTGVIGHLLSKYHIGLTADPYSVDSIAASIAAIYDYELDVEQCNAFNKQHSPDAFLKHLIAI